MKVFIDTSACYALAARQDANHEQATQVYDSLLASGALFVLTDHILAESATLIRRRLGYSAARDFLKLLEEGEALQLFQIIDVDRTVIQAARELFLQDPDPKLSFVDAISFAAMRAHRVHRFFAFDEHFGKAGFHDVRR